MAIIRIKKVTAYVMKQDSRKVMRALQKAGVLEVSRTRMEGADACADRQDGAAVAERLASVSAAIDIIRRYDHTKKSFLTPSPPKAEQLRTSRSRRR